jgi:hypothetical protein
LFILSIKKEKKKKRTCEVRDLQTAARVPEQRFALQSQP